MAERLKQREEIIGCQALRSGLVTSLDMNNKAARMPGNLYGVLNYIILTKHCLPRFHLLSSLFIYPEGRF